MYITSRSKSKLNDHFTSLLHLNLFGTLPKFIVTLLWTCLKVNSWLSRFSRPPWCSLHNLQSFAISLPVLCGASLPVRFFFIARDDLSLCVTWSSGLRFSMATGQSPGMVALLLWASTKCEIADITDMIETEFKTIGKGSPVLEAFPPEPPKVPISRQPGLISARFLGPGKWNFRQPRQHAAKLVKRIALAILHSRAANSFPRNSRCSSLVVLQRS